jgi:hypothetical protein
MKYGMLKTHILRLELFAFGSGNLAYGGIILEACVIRVTENADIISANDV